MPAASPPKRFVPNTLLLVATGAAFLLLACLTLLVGGYYFFAPQITTLLQRTTPQPTLPCLQPTLLLGNSAYRIETTSLEPDGSLPNLPKKAGVAYWIGTQPNYIFLLPQVRQNLESVPSLKAGDPLIITAADCSQRLFVVQSVEAHSSFQLQQVDQTASAATLVLPIDPKGSVLIVSGVSGPAAAQVQPATPADTPTPPPSCDQMILQVASRRWSIQPITRSADGSLVLPGDAPEIAFWVQGSEVNPVFVLSRTPDNLSFEASLTAGTEATVAWEDCRTSSYILFEPQPGSPDDPALFDQSTSAITIFLQEDPSAGFRVIKGEPLEVIYVQPATPDPSQVQAEVSLLETTTTSNGQTIQVSVSILNTGQSAFKLNVSDISLTPQGASPVAPQRAKPSLPRQIKPGESETFTFTFPRPASPSAVFRILTVEYDLEGY